MQNIIYIFIILFLFSCQNDKRTNSQSKKEEEKINDTTAPLNRKASTKPIEKSPPPTETNHPVENILKKRTPDKVKSISELWRQYKDSKTLANKYITKDSLDSVVTYLSLAADAAYELNRKDIATWQLNNIGYHSINKFKKETDYDSRMQQLATFNNLKKKGLFIEKTKNVFRDNFYILSRAKQYLHNAQILDNELEPTNRTEIIKSNIEFIEWIENYISITKR